MYSVLHAFYRFAWETCISKLVEPDELFPEKELKQLLEMEFGNVLSNIKVPQERWDSTGIENVEVSSIVGSRKLTVLQVSSVTKG